MDFFEKAFPQNLYHSYVVEGEPEETAKALLAFLIDRGEIDHDSPDLLLQKYESLSMDDSYQIKDWHSHRCISQNKKICILAAKFINREAEQTLLKIIEEPLTNTHFFIIIPDASILQPTILSRVQIIKTNLASSPEQLSLKEAARFFLAYALKDRVEHVALIVKNNKEAVGSGQLRHYAISLVNEIEGLIYLKFKKDKKNSDIQFQLNELAKARDYLSLPGSSVKMILEHLALIL